MDDSRSFLASLPLLVFLFVAIPAGADTYTYNGEPFNTLQEAEESMRSESPAHAFLVRQDVELQSHKGGHAEVSVSH